MSHRRPDDTTLFTELAALRARVAELEQQLANAQTHSKQADRERADALLDVLFASAPVGLGFVDTNLRFLRVNQTLAHINGASAQEHIGRTLHDIVPDIAPQLEPIYRDVLATGRAITDLEVSSTTPLEPALVRHWLASYYPVQASGSILGVGIVVQEITERISTVAALARSQAQLAGVIASAMDAIITVDSRQHIMLFNKAAEQVFFCPAAEALGQPLDRFIPETYRERHRAHIEAFGKTGITSRSMGSPLTLMGQRTTGEQFPIEASISHVAINGEKLYTVILRDITERRRLEQQLVVAQKMEGVGRLAGGVAHDFNNLLTAINGYSDLIASALPPNHVVQQDLHEITRATARAASLTRQLLTFARRQVITPETTNLNDLLLDLERLLQRVIGEDILLELGLTPAMALVLVDPGQIEQVVVNLAINARDAMPDGGKLLIETDHVIFEEGYSSRHLDLAPGQYVLLAVSDTGVGMPSEVLARVFEPFFTTKSPDRGTGLGLATCYGIVKRHGGSIWPYSEVGVGSTFKIYLPQANVPLEQPAQLTTPTTVNGGNELVLVVEDELAVRALIARTLRSQGYTVLEATNGVEALDLITAQPAIDLIITDVVMPHMNGVALAEQVRELFPTIKVLFISGYTDNLMMGQMQLETSGSFLQKPFSPNALALKVRRVLEGEGRGEF